MEEGKGEGGEEGCPEFAFEIYAILMLGRCQYDNSLWEHILEWGETARLLTIEIFTTQTTAKWLEVW